MVADQEQAAKWRAEFGSTLRSLRTDLGLSQMTLANKVGLHPTYLSSVERGERNISLVNIRILADGLGVHARALFPDG